MSSDANARFRGRYRDKGAIEAIKAENLREMRKIREEYKRDKGIIFTRTTNNRYFKGNTLVAIDKNGRFILNVGESDPNKEKIHDRIAAYQYPGKKQPVLMAASDNYIIVSQVGQTIRLVYVNGEITPEQKEAIEKLKKLFVDSVYEMPENRDLVNSLIAASGDSRD